MPKDYAADLEFFEKNGYLVIPDFFSPEELSVVKDEIHRLIDNYQLTEEGSKASFKTDVSIQQDDAYFLSSGDKISFFLEETAVDQETGELIVPKREAFNKVAHALHDRNSVFEKFSYHPSLLKIVQDLGLKQPQIVQSMYIFKSAKVGGQIYPHQDSSFLQTTPATCIGTWVGLEDATEENGCMWFVPGSHKVPVERMFNLNDEGNGCTFNIPNYKYDTSKAIPVPTTAGSLVIIHGGVIHFSGHNNSGKNRNAYSLHVIDGEAEYLKTNWLQRPEEFPFRDFITVSRELYPQIASQQSGDDSQVGQ